MLVFGCVFSNPLTYSYASSDGDEGTESESEGDESVGDNDSPDNSDDSGIMEEGESINDIDDSGDSTDDTDDEQAQDEDEEICDNGTDDNGDGLVDGQDPITCPDEDEEICDNGIDDNNDGLVDKADLVSCPDDGIEKDDNEGEGQEQDVDATGQGGAGGLFSPLGSGANEEVGGEKPLFGGASDQSLSEKQEELETVSGEICDDGIDNDGDNLVDIADDECAGPQTQRAATTMTYEDWHNNCIGMAGFGGCPISPPCDSPPPTNLIETLNYDDNCPAQYQRLQQQQQPQQLAQPLPTNQPSSSPSTGENTNTGLSGTPLSSGQPTDRSVGRSPFAGQPGLDSPTPPPPIAPLIPLIDQTPKPEDPQSERSKPPGLPADPSGVPADLNSPPPAQGEASVEQSPVFVDNPPPPPQPMRIKVTPDGFWQGVGLGLVDSATAGLILDVELPGPENYGGEGYLLIDTLSILDPRAGISLFKSAKNVLKHADDLAGVAIDASSSTVKATAGSGDDLVKGISRSGDEAGDFSKGSKGADASPPDGGGGSGSGGGSTPPTGPPVLRGPIPDELPHSLPEQIVLKKAKAGDGVVIIPSHLLGDKPRLDALYGPGDWVKMEAKHVTPDGKQINVHWFKNKTTGLDKEFKFKIREASKTGYSGSSITGTFPRGGVGNPGPSVPIPPGAPAPIPP